MKKLKIHEWKITDEGITNLFQTQLHKTLEEIDVSSCKILSNHSLLSIAANCPHLKKICISDINNITNESLWELFHKCEKLIDMTYYLYFLDLGF